MTAEIAILNKLAVALAADSAVTISTADRDEKIFDSADKLFELSRKNPIGIMIYNGMDFAEIPIQTLVCNFRNQCDEFASIEDAAVSFLTYLNRIGTEAPPVVKSNELKSALRPFVNRIKEQNDKAFQQFVQSITTSAEAENIRARFAEILTKVITSFSATINKMADAEFVGAGAISFNRNTVSEIVALVEEVIPAADQDQRAEIVELSKNYLRKRLFSDNLTGLVIAGFGKDELFPTLCSFEIDGMVCGRLKFIRTNLVDIDRSGKRAAVIPFAQKEMVDRFLYGLDNSIQSDIAEFCENSVSAIRTSLLSNIEIENEDDRAALEVQAVLAEGAFMKGLNERAFEKIRNQSQTEIEMMVEFMPKPELSKMAEALVNLTSIKRRVSRGFETVGGPIDVAVISRTEGFIWIKRKHYFDADLNVRYVDRVKSAAAREEEHASPSPKKSRQASGQRTRTKPGTTAE